MRILQERKRLVAGILTAGAACVLVSPILAQDERTGVSHPDSSIITADPADTAKPNPSPKPSAAVPSAAASDIVYGPYVPYHAPGTSAPAAVAAPLPDPDGSIVTAESANQPERRLLSTAADSNDPDARIVTSVPVKPGQVGEGTLIKARLDQEISTLKTAPGTKFTAHLDAPVMNNGKVILPVGSVLEGRVTMVHGGKRIGGPAAIHLEPQAVTLPDGSVYTISARVIDTDSWDHTKVDEEGTIERRDNTKRTLGAMSLATGGTMAAGAVLAGPPGALIGAGIGAGVSSAVWLKQDRQAELPQDLGIVFSLTEPMSTTPVNAAMIDRQMGSHAGGE